MSQMRKVSANSINNDIMAIKLQYGQVAKQELQFSGKNKNVKKHYYSGLHAAFLCLPTLFSGTFVMSNRFTRCAYNFGVKTV